MGIFTVDYESNGLTTTIDIPTRIFCEGYYPNLVAMLSMIGVNLQATNHSAAFAGGDGEVFFHYGNRQLLGRSWDYPKGSSWLRGDGRSIALDSLRFFRRAREDCRNNRSAMARQTLREYLAEQDFSDVFVNGVLLPTLSTMCTCDYDSVLNYPADMILECLTCGVMQQGVMRAESGVHDIVPRLLEGTEQLCGVAVEAVLSEAEGPVIVCNGQRRAFDQVVVAAQAQHAADMVGELNGYREKLTQVPFEHSSMTVHTDTSVLPRSRTRLSPVTHHVPDGAARPEATVNLTRAFATYRDQQPVFQTWNPIRELKPGTQLAEVSFTRPLVTLDSRAAIKELREETYRDNHGVWFCGAYMADKVPLLEAAVDSAVAVATRLGATIPWQH